MNRHCSNPDDPICRMGCAGNAACRFAVLRYIAPMECGAKERAELAKYYQDQRARALLKTKEETNASR